MGTITVLVTASRTWPSGVAVERELGNIYRALAEGDELLVRHGDCPEGGDHFAQLWVRLMVARGHTNVREDPCPANWKLYDRAAGFIRNGAMVDQGATLCLAFIHDRSNGATDCAKKAKKAGILTELIPSGTTPDDWLDE